MEVVHALLSEGAKVNLHSDLHCSPLNRACQGGHTEVVCTCYQLEPKSIILLTKLDGLSPLLMACHEVHTDVVRVLLSGGAKLDLLVKDGLSPLHDMACNGGHMDVVLVLLSGGAKVDLQINNGLSPLHIACRHACHMGNTLVVRTLLSGGAKVNLQTTEGKTPMHTACQYGHVGNRIG